MGKIRENISQNIAKHRKIQSISQKELAERLGTKPSTVSSWEQKVSSPNAEMLFEMCKIFRITVDEIYGVDEDETEYQFLKVCEWLEEADFEICQDEDDKKYNQYQVCHFDHGTITVMHQQDLIDLIDAIVKDSEYYQERFIIDKIKMLFLDKKPPT